jgi:hypothetical protein
MDEEIVEAGLPEDLTAAHGILINTKSQLQFKRSVGEQLFGDGLYLGRDFW